MRVPSRRSVAANPSGPVVVTFLSRQNLGLKTGTASAVRLVV